MTIVYKTTSLSNGNYILVGLEQDDYMIVASDINGEYSKVLKGTDKIKNIPFMTQLTMFSEWQNNLNLSIPPSDNFAFSIDNKKTVLNNDYHGIDSISVLVEGVGNNLVGYNVSLIYDNSKYMVTTDIPMFTISNIEKSGIRFIEFDGNREVYNELIHNNVERGYISASVVIAECNDSDFVIQCFRSSDKQFIGEYPIIDNRYTIDNLNLSQTYDIMLHDKNKVVETQVHSRRTPSIY